MLSWNFYFGVRHSGETKYLTPKLSSVHSETAINKDVKYSILYDHICYAKDTSETLINIFNTVYMCMFHDHVGISLLDRVRNMNVALKTLLFETWKS